MAVIFLVPATDVFEHTPPTGWLAKQIRLHTRKEGSGCHIWEGRCDDAGGPAIHCHKGKAPETYQKYRYKSVRRIMFSGAGRQFVFAAMCENSRCVNPKHIGISRTLRPSFDQPRCKNSVHNQGFGTVLDKTKSQAIIDLHKCGWTSANTGAALGVSQSTVSRFLQKNNNKGQV